MFLLENSIDLHENNSDTQILLPSITILNLKMKFSKFYLSLVLIAVVSITGILVSYYNINFHRAINVAENKIIILNGTTFGPGSITSTTDMLFGIGFDQIIHVDKYATGNYNFVLKPGSSGIIGMKYHHLKAPCNGIWQNDICLTIPQQNTSGNNVSFSHPTKAFVYAMPDMTFVGNGSTVGIAITEQWRNVDNFTSFVNYTINTTPQANGTYDIILRDSGTGQFLTIGEV